MNSSIEEVTSSNVLTQNKGIRTNTNLITYDEIATKLLNERLLLTALELHAELCEVDRELPILRDFFSNPNNFECLNIKPDCSSMPRSSSQATLDSLDMTRYSEDGAGVDERVAVLEFELRKAKDNINSLRENLTVVTESEVSSPDKNLEKQGQFNYPIKPHEQRALNFLINEYLLVNSYKLTSITFSDENDNQDFEDWLDVGLNIPKPPELLFMYREFMRGVGYEKPPQTSIGIQTDSDLQLQETLSELNNIKSELANLKQHVSEIEKEKIILEQKKDMLEQEKISLEEERSSLQQMMENLNSTNGEVKQISCSDTIQTSNSTSPDKFELLESSVQDQDVSNVNQEVEEEDVMSMVVSIGETETSEKDWARINFAKIDLVDGSSNILDMPSRYLPPHFRKEIIKHCLINTPLHSIEEPLKDGISLDTLPEILSQVLPVVVPNIIANKRQEIIPLIVGAVQLSNSSEEREKLLQLLFNMHKKPQEEERQIILAGLVSYSKLNKESLSNEEILNICWEQSQHKYSERRLLASECCSALALYTSSGIRNSLMIAMLQQMLLDDREPDVRTSVVKSLSLLISFMDDPDKYFQCEELVLTALDDVSSDVIHVTNTIFVPILAQWALSLKRLQSHLLTRILGKLRNLLKPHSPNKDYIDGNKVIVLIDVLQCLIPYTVLSVSDTEIVHMMARENKSSELPKEFLSLCENPLTNPKIFFESEIDSGILINTFLENSWENSHWLELDWFTEKLIMDLLEISQTANTVHENIIKKLLTYIQSLCLGFGKNITRSRILTAFKPVVSNLEKEIMEVASTKKLKNLTVISAYLAILSAYDRDEFVASFKHFLILLAMNGADVSGLRIAVMKFCGQDGLREAVLTGLWEGIVNNRSIVRCATAGLFSSIVSAVSGKLIDVRIAPAIVTLASDQDVSVRAAAVPVLGKLITDGASREAKDKARMTLETLAKEFKTFPSSLVVTLVITFAAITPSCPRVYIEEVVAPMLTSITSASLQQALKPDLNSALVEAYTVLSRSSVSEKCIINSVLPGLKYLESLVSDKAGYKESVHSLIQDLEAKVEVPKMERSSSSGSGISLSIPSVSMGQGVEDMKQRVTKIFNKTNSPGMSGIFRKK